MAQRFPIVIIASGLLLAAPAWAQSFADATDAAPSRPAANILDSAIATPTAPLLPEKPQKTSPKTSAKKKVTAKNDLSAETPKIDALQPALAAPDKEADGVHEKPDLFTSVLANVYNTHPQLKAQRESLEATDENVNLAVSNIRPNVAAGYSRGRISTDFDNSSKSTIKTATAIQPVFVAGALSGIQGAKQRVKAGQAQLMAVEQQVLFDAVVAYCNVVNRLAVLQVNQNNVDLLNKQYLATKARFTVGEITRTDMAQAQSRLATAKANERTALGALDVDRATFARVVGFDAPAALSLPPEPKDLPLSIDEAQKQAESNEPTLNAAIANEKASRKEASAFKGAIFPSVNAQASHREVDNTVGGSQAITNDSLTLNLVVPLYQTGAEYARIRQAEDMAQRAKYLTMDTKNAVVQTVAQSWQNYVMAKEVITSNEEAVRAAKMAMNSIQQENKFGTRTTLDVLNTQQDMFNAQVNLVNARVSERQAAYRLLAAVGRLTAENLHLPVDINDPKQHYDNVKYKLIGF